MKQDATEVASVHLRPIAGAVVGILEKNGPLLIEYRDCLAAGVDDLQELSGEPGCLKRALPVCLWMSSMPPCGRAFAEASAS